MSEWETDRTTGRRYRMIGGCVKEYEKEIHTTVGVYTPEQMPEVIRDYYRAKPQREPQQDKRRWCPFGTSRFNDTRCGGEDCALFVGSGCVLSRVSANSEHDTEGLRCPFAGAACKCRADCALYNNGCVLTGIINQKGENR